MIAKYPRNYENSTETYSSENYSIRTTGEYRNNDFSEGLEYEENKKRGYKLRKRT